MSITALSPLDGRYARQAAPLAPLFSEYGLIKHRLAVEVAWFVALEQLQLGEFKPLPAAAKQFLLQLVTNFDTEQAAQVKAIETVTNHDVKAVEYWLTGFTKPNGQSVEGVFAQAPPQAAQVLLANAHFVHFACTSEDINNTAYAMMLQTARAQVLLPRLDVLHETLRHMARLYAPLPMLSRTHGQGATPTTVGKELANFAVRLARASQAIATTPLPAKMNGAVGNYNAHIAAYPAEDWEAFSRHVVQQELHLTFQEYSTQIEPHDGMSALFHAFVRANTVLLDLSRDMWGYISLGYFRQKIKDGEIGSSTMPHKINPIDFENAEGNLGLANALLEHMASKLPVSRWQRDLSDSTVLRNTGVALGHCLLAYESLIRGLSRLEIDAATVAQDLEVSWEVLAEPIQTVMRRYGLLGAYEKLKQATQGKAVTEQALHAIIEKLDIPSEHKAQLLSLTPATYIGKAAELARRCGE